MFYRLKRFLEYELCEIRQSTGGGGKTRILGVSLLSLPKTKTDPRLDRDPDDDAEHDVPKANRAAVMAGFIIQPHGKS